MSTEQNIWANLANNFDHIILDFGLVQAMAGFHCQWYYLPLKHIGTDKNTANVNVEKWEQLTRN